MIPGVKLGYVVQPVVSSIADQGVMSSIPTRPQPVVEFDHEIFSMVILLLLLIQEGLLLVTSESMCTEFQSTG